MTKDYINDAMKEQVKKQEDIRIQLVNQSFIMLMRNSRDFRRFVWFMIGESGLVGQPFTGHRETTDFNCGNRNTGILLFQLIDQFCPEYFSIMMKEAKEDSAYDHGQQPDPTGNSTGGNPYDANPSDADSIAVITGKSE